MATPSRILSTLASQGMPSMWEDASPHQFRCQYNETNLGAVGPAM